MSYLPQVVGDATCTLNWSDGRVMPNGWILNAYHESCPDSMNPKGETTYYITLPSGLIVLIPRETYEKLDAAWTEWGRERGKV